MRELLPHIRIAVFIVSALTVISGCATKRDDALAPILPQKQARVLLVFANDVDTAAAWRAFEKARVELYEQANIHLLNWEQKYLSHKTSAKQVTNYLLAWKSFLARHNTEDYDLIYIMLPGSEEVPLGQYPVYGYAEGVGLIGKVPNAIAYGVVTGNLKEDTVVILHELAHLFGASHTSRGIMNVRPPRERRTLAFDDRSLNEMHTKQSGRFQSVRGSALTHTGSFRSSPSVDYSFSPRGSE